MTKIGSSMFMMVIVLIGGCVQRDSGHTGPHGADVVVTATGPEAPISVGHAAAFAIKVANNGPDDALDVKLLDTVGVQSKLVSMTCAAAGAVVCPTPVGVSMFVPKLPNGSSMNFVVTLRLDGSDTGTIVNSLVAQLKDDPDPNNNSVAMDVLVR